MHTLLVAVLLGLALAGCQRSSVPASAAPPEIVGSLTVRYKADGDELMKQQRHEEAAVKYQAALNEAPSDIPVRYALAVALSYLPARRDEAVDHFRTVVQRGTSGSPEVRAAREWLANARELEGLPSSSASSATASSATSSTATSDSKKGHVLGKITWGDIEPRKKMVRLNVSLIGDEAETRDVRMGRPDFKIGKGYEFRNVPPGAYRLLAEVAGTPMWDLKVVVPAEKPTTLDLTESNASVARDFNPPTD
jgi:hypothetical protein